MGPGGFRVSTESNINPSCIELELGLGFDKMKDWMTILVV